jgi:hypothetical protein
MDGGDFDDIPLSYSTLIQETGRQVRAHTGHSTAGARPPHHTPSPTQREEVPVEGFAGGLE